MRNHRDKFVTSLKIEDWKLRAVRLQSIISGKLLQPTANYDIADWKFLLTKKFTFRIHFFLEAGIIFCFISNNMYEYYIILSFVITLYLILSVSNSRGIAFGTSSTNNKINYLTKTGQSRKNSILLRVSRSRAGDIDTLPQFRVWYFRFVSVDGDGIETAATMIPDTLRNSGHHHAAPPLLTDDDGLIIPRKPVNPVRENAERQNLHKELLFNQRM